MVMHDLTSDARTAITSPVPTIAVGLDLIDNTGAFVADISDDFDPASSQVQRQNNATVHGACSLLIARELNWGKDMVRPWMQITAPDGTTTGKTYLGVYVLTTPQTKHGEDPVTYQVPGYDLLYPLSTNAPGDSYVVAAATTLQAMLEDLVAAAGLYADVVLDGTMGSETFDNDGDGLIWPLMNSNSATWLTIANQMLGLFGYTPLWANHLGQFRSGPVPDNSAAPADWTFDVADTNTDLVAADWQRDFDVFTAPNFWRFIFDLGSQAPGSLLRFPSVDNGLIYEPVINATDPALTAAGRIIRKTSWIQPSPLWNGADEFGDANYNGHSDSCPMDPYTTADCDRVVAADQPRRTFTLNVDPLPTAGHVDIVAFDDGTDTWHCSVVSWVLKLDGSPGQWALISPAAMSARASDTLPLDPSVSAPAFNAQPTVAGQIVDDGGGGYFTVKVFGSDVEVTAKYVIGSGGSGVGPGDWVALRVNQPRSITYYFGV